MIPKIKLCLNNMYSISDILKLNVISCINESFEDCYDNFSLVLFLKNCNLRCNYCYNIEIAKGKQIMNDVDIAEYLNNDFKYIDCITFSGGEALLTQANILYKIISFFRERNENIIFKLDTNGTLPKNLDYVINNLNIKYISIDIKRWPLSNYQLILPPNYKRQINKIVNNIFETIYICEKYLYNNILSFIEFRTTILPDMTEKEIKKIENFIKTTFKNFYDKKVIYTTKEYLEF